MSCNRENIIWQSEDGTWSRGFYDFYSTGDTSDPDYDYEWDVEYTDEFNWVSVNHPTRDAAHASWDGVNPGGFCQLEWSEETAAECRELDKKAAAQLERDKKERKASRQFYNLPLLPRYRGTW